MNEKIIKIVEIMAKTFDFDEDIKQDVFIKIMEKINLDDYPQETLLNLVRKMLKNEMIDQKRKERMQYIDADASDISSLGVLIDDDYEDIAEQDIWLKNALKQLDEKEQQIMIMTLEGNKTSFIASQLNEKENNIKSIKRRAINKLRKKL